jgi:serine phosphatase RsbU (regulator of sigma subunit)
LLKALLPAGLFCAAAFLALDRTRTELTVWNGGLPAVLLRATRTGGIRLHNSQSLPLGLVTSKELDVQPSQFAVDEAEEVFVYSDGLTEAENNAGELFGQERVNQLLARPGNLGDGYDLLLTALNVYRGGARAGDDVSLVVVSVGALRLPAVALRAVTK